MLSLRNLNSRLSTRAGIVGIGAMSAITMLSGTAYAIWSVTGTGTVSKKSSDIQALTVTATMTGHLYPGAVSPVSLTINNPNVFPVLVNGVTFGTVTSGDPVNCPASNVVMTPPVTVDVAIPAQGSATSTVPGAGSMLLTAPNGCAGVTFTVSATVSGASA